MPTLTTRLYVVRHAIAEDISADGLDQTRRLTKKGRKSFARLVRRLADAGMEVDLVATSPLALTGPIAGSLACGEDPTLPVPFAPVPVKRTRVLIAVGNDGAVRHAVLDRSCGNEALDAEAVQLCRQLRFEAEAGLDPLAVTWGAARFVWALAPAN